MGVGTIAKFEIGPLDEYIQLLEHQTTDNIQNVIKKSIYNGASMTADQIRREIESLPVVEKVTQKGVLKWEKEDLLNGFGVSPFQVKNNSTDVKIGFDGYGCHKTKTHKNGVPIPLTARSILKGTSFRPKNDFVRRAVNKIKKKVIEKMNETINEEIKKEMSKNGN